MHHESLEDVGKKGRMNGGKKLVMLVSLAMESKAMAYQLYKGFSNCTLRHLRVLQGTVWGRHKIKQAKLWFPKCETCRGEGSCVFLSPAEAA